MSRTVLLTGANGFLGSHIADALMREGYKLKAMVRKTSNLQWLEGKPAERVYAELNDPGSLRAALEGVDAVIHNAGVVSASGRYHYYYHNTEGTRNLLDAVRDAAGGITRFVYVSSQAAGGPTESATPRTENDPDCPITPYGHSKLLAEAQVRKFGDSFPVTIIRPPALYGPRDTAWLPLFHLITKGWLPLIGKQRELTLTHGQDVALQVLLQLEKPEAVGEIFHAAPFPPTTYEEFGDTAGDILGSSPKKLVVRDFWIRYLYPLVYPLLPLFGVAPPFRKDKLPDVFAPRWTISGDKAKELLGFEGIMPLQAGLGQTIEWYRWKKWLLSKRDVLKEKGKSECIARRMDGHERRYDPTCDLCGLAIDGEVKTKKHYEDEDFVIVDCLICRIPMAVLKEHRVAFTADEKERLLKIFTDLFGDGQHPDFEQRRIPEHAHVHYRSTPHALPWQRRPD